MLTPTAIHTLNSFLSRTVITELNTEDVDSDDIIRFHFIVLLTAIQMLHEQKNIPYARIAHLVDSLHIHSEPGSFSSQPQNTPWKIPSADKTMIETLLVKSSTDKWVFTWQRLCARYITQQACSDTELITLCKVIGNNLTPNWPYRHFVHASLLKYLQQKTA